MSKRTVFPRQNRRHRSPEQEQGGLIEHISSDYFEAMSALQNRSRVMVYVEGYDDIAFWRPVFDEFEQGDPQGRTFEITTPVRNDFAKGKKVVLQFAEQSGPHLLLCVDSDFDYLFDQLTPWSRQLNGLPYLIQTYTYAIENYQCYPPSLHSICTRATKKDQRIFDFEAFMSAYSRIIHPLFVWYAYAARINKPDVFALSDFRQAVRINFLVVENDGADTLAWLQNQVQRRLEQLRKRYADLQLQVDGFADYLHGRGVTPEQTHLYMQGHTLFENVVLVAVDAVCRQLRRLSVDRIMSGSRQGMPQSNELSAYNNSLKDVEELLIANTGYRHCPLYLQVRKRMDEVLNQQKIATFEAVTPN